MPRSMFERGYPRLAEFSAFRDPGMNSAMSRRLMPSIAAGCGWSDRPAT